MLGRYRGSSRGDVAPAHRLCVRAEDTALGLTKTDMGEFDFYIEPLAH